MHNRTQPITVADFDLPERGLIVFGLEDGNNEGIESFHASIFWQYVIWISEQDNESAARLILQDRTTKTCFASSRLLAERCYF